MIWRSEVPGSSRKSALGAAGSVLTTAPATFASDGTLVPISFVAVTYTTTRSSSTRLKGAARRLAIGTRQKRFAMTVASAPSQLGSTSYATPPLVRIPMVYSVTGTPPASAGSVQEILTSVASLKVTAAGSIFVGTEAATSASSSDQGDQP